MSGVWRRRRERFHSSYLETFHSLITLLMDVERILVGGVSLWSWITAPCSDSVIKLNTKTPYTVCIYGIWLRLTWRCNSSPVEGLIAKHISAPHESAIGPFKNYVCLFQLIAKIHRIYLNLKNFCIQHFRITTKLIEMLEANLSPLVKVEDVLCYVVIVSSFFITALNKYKWILNNTKSKKLK